MNNDKLLEDPTNRVVVVFDESEQCEAARQELLQQNLRDEDLRVLHGSEAAERVDSSAKWFADTDEEIQRYSRELRAGNTVLSVPVTDGAGRERIHDIVKRHDARLVTHFGRWVTEMMK